MFEEAHFGAQHFGPADRDLSYTIFPEDGEVEDFDVMGETIDLHFGEKDGGSIVAKEFEATAAVPNARDEPTGEGEVEPSGYATEKTHFNSTSFGVVEA